MRHVITIALIALAISLFGVGTSSAEGMSVAEFKKLVIGNTLQRSFYNNKKGKQIDARFYFKNEKTIRRTVDGFPNVPDEEWNVPAKGKWCRISSFSFKTFCFYACQLKGDKLTCKNRRGKKRIFTFLKGKHEY